MYGFFPAFTCANDIGSLLNSLFGVKVFNIFPCFTSLSCSIGGMSDKSTDSTLSVDSSISSHGL